MMGFLLMRSVLRLNIHFAVAKPQRGILNYNRPNNSPVALLTKKSIKLTCEKQKATQNSNWKLHLWLMEMRMLLNIIKRM
jgi:hypothetical protein